MVLTNFFLMPLTFLGGVFYSIERLPDFFQSISLINPFFYIIDGFRYGFLGTSDGSVEFGIFYLILLFDFVVLDEYANIEEKYIKKANK